MEARQEWGWGATFGRFAVPGEGALAGVSIAYDRHVPQDGPAGRMSWVGEIASVPGENGSAQTPPVLHRRWKDIRWLEERTRGSALRPPISSPSAV